MMIALAVLGGWFLASLPAALLAGLVLRKAERCERAEPPLHLLIPTQRTAQDRVLVLPDGT